MSPAVTDGLALACYGKLPFWPEYLEVGLVSPGARALKDWLHRGAEQARLDASGPVGGPGPDVRRRFFLFGVPGGGELIAGLIAPSADQGGLRSFPFALVAQFPRRDFGRQYALAPLALAQTWGALEECRRVVAAAPDRDAFVERLAGCRAPRPLPREAVRGFFDAWLAERAEGLLAAEDGAALARLDRAMPQVVAAVGRGEAPLPLVLPAGTSLEQAAFAASFWLSLLNADLFWRRFTPAVFIDAPLEDGPRRATFVGEALPPGDYAAALGVSARGSFRPAEDGAAGAAPDVWPTFRAMFKRWSGR